MDNVELLPTNTRRGVQITRPKVAKIYIAQSILAGITLAAQLGGIIYAATPEYSMSGIQINKQTPLMLSCYILLALQAICVLVALCTGRWSLPFHNFSVHIVSLGLSIANPATVCAGQANPYRWNMTADKCLQEFSIYEEPLNYMFVSTVLVAFLQLVMSVIGWYNCGATASR